MYILGICQLKIGKFKDALNSLRAAIFLNRLAGELWVALSVVLQKFNFTTETEEAVITANRILPNTY